MGAQGQWGGRDLTVTETTSATRDRSRGPKPVNGKVPVYDADAHIAEPTSVWEEYADPKCRDLIARCRIMGDGSDAALMFPALR